MMGKLCYRGAPHGSQPVRPELKAGRICVTILWCVRSCYGVALFRGESSGPRTKPRPFLRYYTAIDSAKRRHPLMRRQKARPASPSGLPGCVPPRMSVGTRRSSSSVVCPLPVTTPCYCLLDFCNSALTSSPRLYLDSNPPALSLPGPGPLLPEAAVCGRARGGPAAAVFDGRRSGTGCWRSGSVR